MGNNLTSNGTVINQAGNFAAFSGTNPGETELGAFVYKNENDTWSQFGSTCRVKEQTASVTGYTGSINSGGTATPINQCAISENAHFVCITSLLVGQGGAASVGFTGAAYIFEFDTGTTGYGSPTQQLIRPTDTVSAVNEYSYYGTNPTFGPAINSGTTDTLMLTNENAKNFSLVSADFRNIYDIWEYNGSFWERNVSFSYSIVDPDVNEFRHYYNAASKTVFTVSGKADTLISRTFSDGNVVTTTIIDFGLSGNYTSLTGSNDGLKLYLGVNRGFQIRAYQRNSINDNFSFVETILPSGTNTGVNSFAHFASNNTGDKLIYRFSTNGDIRYNISPVGGAGGSSQHPYISNGSDGNLTEGGVGVNNPNAKSDVKFASGGGYGGSSSDSAALANTGSGGAGRYNTSGTAGSSGFINVRRWNSGIN